MSKLHLSSIARLLLGTIIMGGAVLCASGQALAAERSTVSVGQYASSSVNESTSSQVTVTTNSVTTTFVDGSSDESDGGGTSTYTTSTNATTITTDGGAISTTDTKSSLRRTVASIGSDNSNNTSAGDHASALTGAISGTSDDRSAMPMASHEAPGLQAATARVGGSVRVGWQLLSIRPVIMAQSEFPGGLLAVLPIAPNHDPGKAPAHPDGLLTELTALLASTVVPGSVALVSVLAHTNTALDVLLALIVLLVSTCVSTYGFWLRRTGHTHAARSDMAAGFNFATPLMMSYDLSLSRRRT